MNNAFVRNADITICEITLADWKAFRDFYKGLSNPQHNSGFLQDRDLNAYETYVDLFENFTRYNPYVMFGLWDRSKMIGQTCISFQTKNGITTAHFTGSEMADAYRGLHLTDKFYEVRKEYLRRIGFDGPIDMTIHPDNAPSQRAAARNGFVKTGERNEQGFDILVPAGLR